MFASQNHADLQNIWKEFDGGLTMFASEKILLQNFADGLKS